MKKIFSLILAVLLFLSALPVGEAQSAQGVQTGSERLFLKASSVTMSVVGDQEELYLGVVPAEQVTFESGDESVVTFDGGILTATGVGSTTVWATYGDQKVECAVSCLAQTEGELNALDSKILKAAKRQPPAVDMTQKCTDFSDAGIVGDSITYIMYQWETKYDYLGDVTFLCRGGVSLNGFVIHYKNLYYQGAEMYLEDVVAKSGVKRLYFLMGQSDISAEFWDKIMENWDILLGRILEKSPDVEICLLSLIPRQIRQEPAENKRINKRIKDYNVTLREYARENGYMFIDLAYYVENHEDCMALEYCQDDYHMNETGCIMWMQVLRYYAEFEKAGGILE